ncbi:MAG: FG-GAP-like repeat-containing protein [Myxococcales bacterium]|nr:FG-GAP-like repeat-containing protein [Myxococcales bacterium]
MIGRRQALEGAVILLLLGSASGCDGRISHGDPTVTLEIAEPAPQERPAPAGATRARTITQPQTGAGAGGAVAPDAGSGRDSSRPEDWPSAADAPIDGGQQERQELRDQQEPTEHNQDAPVEAWEALTDSGTTTADAAVTPPEDASGTAPDAGASPEADAGGGTPDGGAEQGGGGDGCQGNAGPTFERVELEGASGGSEKRYGKAIGDLSGDDLPDIVLVSAAGAGIRWYEYPHWTAHAVRSSGSWSEDIQLADIDRDGDLDLVAGNSRGVHWYANPGPGGDPRTDAWGEHFVGSDGTNVHDLEVADVSGDGRTDVVIRYEKENGFPVRVFLQRAGPNVSFGDAIDVNASERGNEGLGLGDLDGDGDVDIALQRIWCENPGGGEDWIEHVYATGLTSQMMVRVADLNLDGRNDIVVSPQSAGSSELAWFTTDDPQGSWTKHTLASGITRMHGLGVGDFNRDGYPDLHTSLRHDLAGKRDHVSIWLSDGEAVPTFHEQVLATTGSHLSKVGDIGKDGDDDVVGANWNGSDPLELWENQCTP